MPHMDVEFRVPYKISKDEYGEIIKIGEELGVRIGTPKYHHCFCWGRCIVKNTLSVSDLYLYPRERREKTFKALSEIAQILGDEGADMQSDIFVGWFLKREDEKYKKIKEVTEKEYVCVGFPEYLKSDYSGGDSMGGPPEGGASVLPVYNLKIDKKHREKSLKILSKVVEILYPEIT
jgi:hypothetical protein